MEWNPQQYLGFADLRLRPALDLLARVPAAAPAEVVDLGCGPGNVTPFLARRWPAATVTGVDASAPMLARARASLPEGRFVEADIAGWRPERPCDVIFSNAALHWLDDHAGLFPHLIGLLAPGGVLAVQMPRNHGAASHTCMIDTIEAGPWRDRLLPLVRAAPTAAPAAYYDVLAPVTRALDIWESEYLQILEGEDPVKEWTKGSALKPFLDALAPDEAARFEADYAARVRAAYPRATDGRTPFPFRRLFLVAVAP
jgi:trans-aconitate 2-methyltransferase